MKGYVKNEGRNAYFILQRQVPPGGKVSFEDAYRSVGKRSGLEENLEFVKWLSENILTKGSWGFYEEEGKPIGPTKRNTSPEEPAVVPEEIPTSTSKTSSKKSKDAVGAGRVLRRESTGTKGTEITPASIIEAAYEEARSLIEKTKDKTVLRKALALTQHFSGKEQHMRHLMKRLEQV